MVLDAPEDEGLERPVAGIVRVEKESQDLTLHTPSETGQERERETDRQTERATKRER